MELKLSNRLFLERSFPRLPFDCFLDINSRLTKQSSFLVYYIKQRTCHEVKRIAKFLGKDLSDEEAERLIHMTHFDQMKDNPKANYSWLDDAGVRDENEAQFMRKGKKNEDLVCVRKSTFNK